MAKRKPLPCTSANCGDNYSRCGIESTYSNRKCRCDPCSAARLEYMHRWRRSKNGIACRKRYEAENREAIRAERKQYSAENSAAIVERVRQWRIANPERYREQLRQYTDETREIRSERNRQWKIDNPDRKREHARQYQHRRRARMMATQVADFTLEQMEQKMAYYGNSCYLQIPDICTGGFDHIDHVKPISKGGAHILANTRPACKPCNEYKSDKWPFEAAA